MEIDQRQFRLILWACAFILPLPAQAPAVNPAAIVQRVAAKCEGATEYLFEGDLELAGQRGANPGKILSKAKVTLAVAPGKYMLRVIPIDKDEYLLVSNGQKNWAFVPKLKQYTEEEGALLSGDDSEDDSGESRSDQEHDMAETWSRLVLPTLAKMYKTAAGVDVNGTWDVKYQNKKQKWPVVRVMSKADQEEGQSLTQIAVDPESLSLGRMMWSNMTRKNGEKTVLQLTVDFSNFRIGESLPESTFDFAPPKNAKLVDAVPIPGQTGSFLLNHPAPDFELKTLDGDKVRLADLRGKPVLLTFWASWCGPCRRELPGLAKIYEEYRAKGLQIYGVNDEGKGAAKKLLLPFPTFDDSGEKAHRLYRIRSIPSVFLIDSQGKIVRFFSGAKDPEFLRTALKSVGL